MRTNELWEDSSLYDPSISQLSEWELKKKVIRREASVEELGSSKAIYRLKDGHWTYLSGGWSEQWPTREEAYAPEKPPQLQRKPNRYELKHVFQDTLHTIDSSKELLDALKKSQSETHLYCMDEEIHLPPNAKYSTIIHVSEARTFEAAERVITTSKVDRVAVLNFASATSPGGGVLEGAAAQEESLCRCSTLYPCLNQSNLIERYYFKNSLNGDYLYTDDCIYSPGIKVIKKDLPIPILMESTNWFDVDVITCAAPNLSHSPGLLSEEDQFTIHVRRAKKILSIAAINGDTGLILGAFGCGAFKNKPRAVAMAFREALKEYSGYFQYVEFAIFHSEYEKENYTTFQEIFA